MKRGVGEPSFNRFHCSLARLSVFSHPSVG